MEAVTEAIRPICLEKILTSACFIRGLLFIIFKAGSLSCPVCAFVKSIDEGFIVVTMLGAKRSGYFMGRPVSVTVVAGPSWE